MSVCVPWVCVYTLFGFGMFATVASLAASLCFGLRAHQGGNRFASTVGGNTRCAVFYDKGDEARCTTTLSIPRFAGTSLCKASHAHFFFFFFFFGFCAAHPNCRIDIAHLCVSVICVVSPLRE